MSIICIVIKTIAEDGMKKLVSDVLGNMQKYTWFTDIKISYFRVKTNITNKSNDIVNENYSSSIPAFIFHTVKLTRLTILNNIQYIYVISCILRQSAQFSYHSSMLFCTIDYPIMTNEQKKCYNMVIQSIQRSTGIIGSNI